MSFAPAPSALAAALAAAAAAAVNSCCRSCSRSFSRLTRRLQQQQHAAKRTRSTAATPPPTAAAIVEEDTPSSPSPPPAFRGKQTPSSRVFQPRKPWHPKRDRTANSLTQAADIQTEQWWGWIPPAPPSVVIGLRQAVLVLEECEVNGLITSVCTSVSTPLPSAAPNLPSLAAYAPPPQTARNHNL